jgi:hypothetical protein
MDFLFDSPPPLVAFLFLGVVTFSSAVPVASIFIYFDAPSSDESGRLELALFLRCLNGDIHAR